MNANLNTAPGFRSLTDEELRGVDGGFFNFLLGYVVGKLIDKTIETAEEGGLMGAYCEGMKNNGTTSPFCS